MMSPEPMAPYALAGLVIRDFCKELWGLACDQLAEVGGAAQSPVPLHEGEDLLQCLADRGELALHVGLKNGLSAASNCSACPAEAGVQSFR
jgi:hypothetical protein